MAHPQLALGVELSPALAPVPHPTVADVAMVRVVMMHPALVHAPEVRVRERLVWCERDDLAVAGLDAADRRAAAAIRSIDTRRALAAPRRRCVATFAATDATLVSTATPSGTMISMLPNRQSTRIVVVPGPSVASRRSSSQLPNRTRISSSCANEPRPAALDRAHEHANAILIRHDSSAVRASM